MCGRREREKGKLSTGPRGGEKCLLLSSFPCHTKKDTEENTGERGGEGGEDEEGRAGGLTWREKGKGGEEEKEEKKEISHRPIRFELFSTFDPPISPSSFSDLCRRFMKPLRLSVGLRPFGSLLWCETD